MTDRQRILDALPPTRTEGATESAVLPSPAAQPPPTTAAAEDLWTRFALHLEALGGRMASTSDVEAIADRPLWIDPELQPYFPALKSVDDPWQAEAGIAAADLAVAETGTVLLHAAPARHRLASLSPPLSILVVPNSAIVATLDEAFPRLKGRTAVLVTGTSRTADIEGILVRGVHGPGELWIVRLPNL
jgi:hypothetical protein